MIDFRGRIIATWNIPFDGKDNAYIEREAKEIRERIIRAVNSHEALVAASEAYLKAVTDKDDAAYTFDETQEEVNDEPCEENISAHEEAETEFHASLSRFLEAKEAMQAALKLARGDA